MARPCTVTALFSGVTLLFWPLALRACWTWKLVALNKIHLPSDNGYSLGYLGRGYKLRGQHVDRRPVLPLLYMAMLYCLRSSFGPRKTKFESSTCTIISDNENINLKMSSFLWQGNLPNRASKTKRLLACHDIHLRRASVKLHLCCYWPLAGPVCHFLHIKQ